MEYESKSLFDVYLKSCLLRPDFNLCAIAVFIWLVVQSLCIPDTSISKWPLPGKLHRVHIALL